MAILEVSHLQKAYGSKQVLVDFSFKFEPGIYGLLGPNGAGKSTLMNIIVGNRNYDAGSIKYNDIEIKQCELVEKIGYMPQQQGVYKNYSVQRFLQYMCLLKNVPKEQILQEVEKCLSLVNLSDRAESTLGSLSGGMKQRVLIAQALLGSPEILIFDEPTAGLDPLERIRIRNLISQISQDKIVIIATHVVPDVEFIANQILFLKQGELILSGSPIQISQYMENKVYELEVEEKDLQTISKEYQVCNLQRNEEKILARIVTDTFDCQYHANVISPNLDDAYLYYFNEEKVL